MKKASWIEEEGFYTDLKESRFCAVPRWSEKLFHKHGRSEGAGGGLSYVPTTKVGRHMPIDGFVYE